MRMMRRYPEPTPFQVEELVARASGTLETLRRSHRRPIIVECSGSPKAGKTTTIDIVAHFFRRNRFRTHAPTEGASKRTPSALKGDLVAFNVWSGSYALSEVLVAANNPYPDDLVILDRGIFDALCWLFVIQKQGNLSPEEFEVFSKFFLLDRWTDLVRLVFLFTCKSSVSMERELQGKLSSNPGTAMNSNTLNQLRSAYPEMEERFGREFTRFFTYDTTSDTTPRGIAYDITVHILDEFGRTANQA